MTIISTTGYAHWTALQKIAFRFFFVFFMLFILLGGNDEVPFYGNIYYPFINFLQGFICWAAKHTMHIEIVPFNRGYGDGGGDATFDYLLYVFIIILSVAITTIWSYTGRKTNNYNKLFYCLLVILRYYMATTMIYFGISKPLRVQFPTITIQRLMERVGDMSPMGLAWTYMSYSAAFNYFIGFAELLCAGLLFFRRTTKLGAVLGFVLLINIVAINFCFDVCVKLSSTTILLMCIFILVPDYERFFNFFLRNREVLPSNLIPYRFAAKWKNVTLACFKYVLILYVLYWNYSMMATFVQINNYAADNAPKSPLYGLYKIETFVKNRDTLQPLTTDTTRWNRFWISHAGSVTIQFMNDSVKHVTFNVDTLLHKVTSHTAADTVHKFYLNYTLQKPDIMILKGQWKNDSIYVRVRKIDLNSFLLRSRGFHMINEVPYNR